MRETWFGGLVAAAVEGDGYKDVLCIICWFCAGAHVF